MFRTSSPEKANRPASDRRRKQIGQTRRRKLQGSTRTSSSASPQQMPSEDTPQPADDDVPRAPLSSGRRQHESGSPARGVLAPVEVSCSDAAAASSASATSVTLLRNPSFPSTPAGATLPFTCTTFPVVALFPAAGAARAGGAPPLLTLSPKEPVLALISTLFVDTILAESSSCEPPCTPSATSEKLRSPPTEKTAPKTTITSASVNCASKTSNATSSDIAYTTTTFSSFIICRNVTVA
mmetsp:Transcript_1168/g.2553  ORF Transcript_1168/g.2553 Transcript_1168/m.2553 type:complete len:239 (+) Transcript_1168:570-1286(+)